MRHLVLVLFLATAALALHLNEQVNCNAAGACNPATCNLPNCQCSSTAGPNIPVADRPQILYLTFDDAFTDLSESTYYRGLFNGTYTNPDGCAIRATHFLTAQYTDYRHAHNYWMMGHEIGIHSITHRTNMPYWQNLDEAGWADEMVGMKRMAGQFSNIPTTYFKGIRTPFLQMGGEEQFTMMHNNGFEYDCSWPTRQYGYINAAEGLWPYTLDFATTQDCPIPECPACSYPGLWVQPMLDLEDSWLGSVPDHPNQGQPCSMLDGCIINLPNNPNPGANDVYDMLKKNFNRVYGGTRAPMGLYVHPGWFYGDQEWHYEGYKMFLKDLTDNYNDVWIVPIKDGLEYVKNPVNTTVLNDQGRNSVLGCAEYDSGDYVNYKCGGGAGNEGITCVFPNVTNEDIPGTGQERRMTICPNMGTGGQQQACPDQYRYPWLGDPCGSALPCNP